MRGTVGPRAGRWSTTDAVGWGLPVGATANRIRIGGFLLQNCGGWLAAKTATRRSAVTFPLNPGPSARCLSGNGSVSGLH